MPQCNPSEYDSIYCPEPPAYPIPDNLEIQSDLSQ